MMFSYGLRGYPTAILEPHTFCPLITQNCCTPEDERSSVKIWNNDLKPRIERYYKLYTESVKYILGYSAEITTLAREYKDSSNTQCKNAALKQLKLGLSSSIAMDVYKYFSLAITNMAEMRKGFFCVMCDARAHQKLQEYWATGPSTSQKRLYYSQSFCRNLVEKTIHASFFTVHYLKQLVDNMARLINCKTGNNMVAEYEIPEWAQNQIKNCYFYKDKYFFFFCENYCERFHLTNANPVIDGNLVQLRKFVTMIMDNKFAVFQYPSNNILINSIGTIEDYFKANYYKIEESTVFFKPAQQEVMLNQYKTDVVYHGGMDPWESTEKALYQLVLSESILKALIWVAVIVYAV